MSECSPELAIIGCGNSNRRDDGVGPHVIGLLRDRGLSLRAGLHDAGTDGAAVMYRARGAKRLAIVDARIPEGNPGAVYEVPGAELAIEPPHSLNLHDFRWDHALYAGRRLYGELFPEEVLVILVEAESLEFGLGLSASVERSAELVAERLAGLAAG